MKLFLASATVFLTLSNASGQVVYNIFSGSGCTPGTGGSTTMDPSPQPISYCQNHGQGKSAYNSIEVLGCSSTCLCFKQYASSDPDANCDQDKALGYNIKMSCFDKCLQDCNGRDCGDTAAPDSASTRLQLTGSGQICTDPVSDEELMEMCDTTGMILDDNGNIVDDWARIDVDSSDTSADFESDSQGGRPEQSGLFSGGSDSGFGGRPGMGGSSIGQGGRPGSQGGMSGRPGGMIPESMSGGRPSGMNSVGSSGPSSGRPWMGGDRPGGLFSSSGLAEKCSKFDCDSLAGNIDCSRFDSMKNTRGGRKGMLYCGCCR